MATEYWRKWDKQLVIEGNRKIAVINGPPSETDKKLEVSRRKTEDAGVQDRTKEKSMLE